MLHELEITPHRKRKRVAQTHFCDGLTNAGFCSTPKRETKTMSTSSKSSNILFNNVDLEISAKIKRQVSDNPYEVIRKSPKKMKKEGACFINPALTLDLSERQINPFEVKRSVNESVGRNCFVNSGLNIRTEVENLAINPFEIKRQNVVEEKILGLDNPALKITSQLRIGVPFQPRIGCRIDFTGINLGSSESHTSSKLLTEQFVPAPDVNVSRKSPQSLSVISEEVLDIEKELDYYQLELENSINEAKIRKNILEQNHHKKCSSNPTNKNDTGTLALAERANEDKENYEVNDRHEHSNSTEKDEKNLTNISHQSKKIELEVCQKAYGDEQTLPFVRSFKKAMMEEDSSNPALLKSESGKNHKSRNNFASDFRRSFRKVIQPSKDKSHLKILEKGHESGKSLIESIRQSFHRCNVKSKIVHNVIQSEDIDSNITSRKNVDSNDISVLDIKERNIFRSPTLISKCNEKDFQRENAIRSSLRKSSKAVKNQVIKSVFHKNLKEYDVK